MTVLALVFLKLTREDSGKYPALRGLCVIRYQWQAQIVVFKYRIYGVAV